MAAETKLGGSLQENLLVLLCWNEKSFQLVRNAVEVNLFTTDIYRTIVGAVYDFIDAHKKPPKDHLPDLLEKELKGKDGELYMGVVQGVRAARKTLNEEYILKQLNNFVRQQKLKLGIIRASELMNDDKIDEAEAEIGKSLKERLSLFDAGTTLQGALDYLKRHEGTLRDALPLAIPELDRYGLGPARKELYALLGPKKGGKTWWLIHLAKRALMMGYKVSVVTLEVGEQLYATRTLQALYSLTLNQAEKVYVTRFEKDNLNRITEFKRDKLDRKSLLTPEGQKFAQRKMKLGKLFNDNFRVKQFPTGMLTLNGYRSYLDSLEQGHNFIPDLCIVDYPKIMKHSADNLRIELGQTLEGLRGEAVDRNMMMAVVGQVNRAGVEKGTSKGTDAAEDFSIAHTADVLLTFSQTVAEYQLGLARLGVDASRISRQNIEVLISQNYDIGQFCMDSAPMMKDYIQMIKDKSGREFDGDMDASEREEE
jgi:hypothetical protein